MSEQGYLEETIEEVNPSSRFFGKVISPFHFTEGTISLDYLGGNFQGTLTLSWKVNFKNEEDNNPSSRNFGQDLSIGKWLDGGNGDIEIY